MRKLEEVGLNRNEKIITLANPHPVSVEPNERIIKVVKKLVEHNHRSLPTVKKGELVGIVTITDILDAFLKGESLEERVESIMTREVIFADANDTIGYVLQKMKILKRGRLPVTSGKKLIGMVGERDYVFNLSEDVFRQVSVTDIMTRKPFFLRPEVSVLDCTRAMVNLKYRRLPISDGKQLLGYITSKLLLRVLFENGFKKKFMQKSVDEIMIKDPYRLEFNKSTADAIRLMKAKKISSVLIVDKKNLLGILTEKDIVNLLW